MTIATIESAQSEPVWTATAEMPKFPALRESIRVDVCIVTSSAKGDLVLEAKGYIVPPPPLCLQYPHDSRRCF